MGKSEVKEDFTFLKIEVPMLKIGGDTLHPALPNKFYNAVTALMVEYPDRDILVDMSSCKEAKVELIDVMVRASVRLKEKKHNLYFRKVHKNLFKMLEETGLDRSIIMIKGRKVELKKIQLEKK